MSPSSPKPAGLQLATGVKETPITSTVELTDNSPGHRERELLLRLGSDHHEKEAERIQGGQLRPTQKLILLCDGTWQSRRSVRSAVHGNTLTSSSATGDFWTNVAILAQSIAPTASKPNAQGVYQRQICAYQRGVGAVEDLSTRLIEGATGAGLGIKVQEGYLFLVDNYRVGDTISLFGFSRGAYTARTLVGFINYAGLWSKTEAAMGMAESWEAYQRRDPSKPETIIDSAKLMFEKTGRWPAANAEHTEKQLVEQAAQMKSKDLDQDIKNWFADSGKRDQEGRAVPPDVDVVGVWDSVGAEGIPGSFISPDLVRFYSSFDPMLPPCVRHAFHAMALFEDRKDFTVTRYYVPSKKAELPADRARRRGQVLRQVWFQGSHSDVGGGHAWHGLSDVALSWMVANLHDAPGGPLIDVDLVTLKALQDRRRIWALQPQHPSRIAVELQLTRQVMHVPDIAAKGDGGEDVGLVGRFWESMVQSSRALAADPESRDDERAAEEADADVDCQAIEEVHHSVVLGGRYNPLKSRQFDELRKRDSALLDRLWARAGNPASLLPTERELRWSEADKHMTPATPTHRNMPWHEEDEDLEAVTNELPSDKAANVAGDLQGTDAQLPPGKPPGVSRISWTTLKSIVEAPTRLLAIIVNRRPVPDDNLKPSIAAQTVQRIRASIDARRKSQS
ncbi:Domain of unknown function DUF2235 [Ceraceosorus bombacis]|uniref:T6SS Phospholipase effector Tle1-like catalytic domain-containing protein n=1 Tax=Ceraceosorus bombacis TaxID=401625 RepID=A0A0P1BC29_9BASI|nr:Domain of unknown function DUF2235 [Ceraceosorus bombacis]